MICNIYIFIDNTNFIESCVKFFPSDFILEKDNHLVPSRYIIMRGTNAILATTSEIIDMILSGKISERLI